MRQPLVHPYIPFNPHSQWSNSVIKGIKRSLPFLFPTLCSYPTPLYTYCDWLLPSVLPLINKRQRVGLCNYRQLRQLKQQTSMLPLYLSLRCLRLLLRRPAWKTKDCNSAVKAYIAHFFSPSLWQDPGSQLANVEASSVCVCVCVCVCV